MVANFFISVNDNRSVSVSVNECEHLYLRSWVCISVSIYECVYLCLRVYMSINVFKCVYLSAYECVYLYLFMGVYTGPFALWVECSPIARETRVQSQVESYQRLKNWYLIPPCLALSMIRVKWSNPVNGVAPFPTSRCSSYWKGSLRVTID